MRILLMLFFSGLTSLSIWSQATTEIYLCDMNFEEEGFTFSSPKNISTNPGYNNQPCFLNDATLVYARNKDGQPDIATYFIKDTSTDYFNVHTPGGEYSPQPIPNSPDLAAVRLDEDGTQRLYRYKSGKQGVEVLIPDLEVAYFAFINENELLASVLGLNQLDLVHVDINSGTLTPMVTNSGRSIQRIPGTALLSYTVLNEQKNFDIYQYDPDTKESYFVCQLPIGVQDYVWYEDYKILIGSGSQLFVYDLFGELEWQEIAYFKDPGFNNITRLAISPDHKRLAFAAEPK